MRKGSTEWWILWAILGIIGFMLLLYPEFPFTKIAAVAVWIGGGIYLTKRPV